MTLGKRLGRIEKAKGAKVLDTLDLEARWRKVAASDPRAMALARKLKKRKAELWPGRKPTEADLAADEECWLLELDLLAIECGGLAMFLGLGFEAEEAFASPEELTAAPMEGEP